MRTSGSPKETSRDEITTRTHPIVVEELRRARHGLTPIVVEEHRRSHGEGLPLDARGGLLGGDEESGTAVVWMKRRGQGGTRRS